MGAIIDGIKDLLMLNRIFLSFNLLWAFVLAYLALTQSSRDCASLFHIMWVFLAFGFASVLVDTIFEVVQDHIYTHPDQSRPESLHALFNAPREYKGVSWAFDWNKDKPHRFLKTNPGCAGCLLFVETVIRFIGNIAVVSLFILTGLSDFTGKDAICPCYNITSTNSTCLQYTGLEWTQEVGPLFWICFGLTAVRIVFGFTYDNYKEKEEEKEEKATRIEAFDNERGLLVRMAHPITVNTLVQADSGGVGVAIDSDGIELGSYAQYRYERSK